MATTTSFDAEKYRCLVSKCEASDSKHLPAAMQQSPPVHDLSSSCELSELSQWLGHDDSTINIVVDIIIIITLCGTFIPVLFNQRIFHNYSKLGRSQQ